jgi:hypothetical protein
VPSYSGLLGLRIGGNFTSYLPSLGSFKYLSLSLVSNFLEVLTADFLKSDILRFETFSADKLGDLLYSTLFESAELIIA